MAIKKKTATKKRAAKKTTKKRATTAVKAVTVTAAYGDRFKLTNRRMSNRYYSLDRKALREALAALAANPNAIVRVTIKHLTSQLDNATGLYTVLRDGNNVSIGCQIFDGTNGAKLLKWGGVKLSA
jgi:hypothetical protein